MRVFIAEKPTLAAEIAGALDPNPRRGDGFIRAGADVVTYCFGHLLEQLKPEEYDPSLAVWSLDPLPFIPPDWRMRPGSKKNDRGQDVKVDGKIVLDPGKVGQLATIKRLVEQATEVINAGDADREGQLIVDEVLEFIGCRRPVLRLWLQELNVPGIRKALGRMKSNEEYLSLCLSAKARSRADFLVGMNGTRACTKLWQEVGNAGMLHVGRVQTPTLWLVYRRERERAEFKPVDHYGVKADVTHPNGAFFANWVPPQSAPFLDDEGRVLSKAEAEKVQKAVAGSPGTVKEVKTEPKRLNQPLPFALIDLQKAANKFGLTPAETLDVAQALYEKHKIISYPRTNSGFLPEEDFANAGNVLDAVKANYGSAWDFPGKPNLSIKSPAWNDKKLEAHFGLVPTIGRKPIGELTANEKLIYGLIVRRFLAQFYPVHEFEQTSVLLDVVGHEFKATGKVILAKGWKVLYEGAGTEDEDQKTAALPKMADGDAVTVTDATLVAKKTEAPPLYDGASLLDAMENVHRYVTDPEVKKRLKQSEGLGTEATRAKIIENLVEHKYIQAVPKKGAKAKGVDYITTEHGRGLLATVSAEVARPDLTAWMEGRLESILKGEMEFDRFCAIAEKLVHKLIAELKSPEQLARVPKVASAEAKPCPKCGGTLTVRTTKDKKSKFWGCRKYPDCKHTEEYVEPPKPGKRGPPSFKGKPRASPGARAPSAGNRPPGELPI